MLQGVTVGKPVVKLGLSLLLHVPTAPQAQCVHRSEATGLGFPGAVAVLALWSLSQPLGGGG